MREANRVPPAISMAEAQAFARVETGEEEALLAGLVRSATAIAEQFTGLALIERPFAETIAADGAWTRLSSTPVRTIELVEALAVDGSVDVLSTPAEIDIDANGDGWVKAGGGGRAWVSGRAGMAVDANGVPESIRQGIARLVAHLFATRDGASGEPPAAVTALWRPYRRMRMR